MASEVVGGALEGEDSNPDSDKDPEEEVNSERVTVHGGETELEINLLELNPGPLFYIPITVNSNKMVALIDSGASSSFVKRSLICDKDLRPGIRTIRGLGSCVITANFHAEISICID